jgi:adenosylcobinamide kinase/adenosylcobinamide-phosphate guanylyltransferase
MDVLVTGIGGAAGWPEPGCRCASCLRAGRENPCRPSSIVIDGRLRLGIGPGAGSTAQSTRSSRIDCAIDTLGAGADGAIDTPGAGADGAIDTPGAGADGAIDTPGAGAGEYLVREIPGGWDVTGPDGTRLLYPSGPGAVLDPPDGAAPYDIAFLDLLGDPFQLGRLRAAGLITARTATLAAFADHRVTSLAELQRQCAFWNADLAREHAGVGNVRYDRREERRVLVLGGARSGKSERAELRVAAEPAVSYVATGPGGDSAGAGVAGGTSQDPEWAARVAAHRARRPAWWRTVETTDLAGLLGAEHDGVLLIDGMGTWLAAVLDDAENKVPELAAAWRQTPNRVVAVSDEVGLSVVPATASGRLFRDWLGVLNRALAAESERAELVVAGRIVPLDG